MVKISRELWNGKYWIVGREKGRIISRVKWNRSNSVGKIKKLYSRNRSFDENISVTKLKNVKEVSVRGKTDKLPTTIRRKNLQYSYYFEGIISGKKRERVYAVSMQHPKTYPVDKARSEALENFYYRISALDKDVYDETIGKAKLKSLRSNNLIEVREGIRYYAPKTT